MPWIIVSIGLITIIMTVLLCYLLISMRQLLRVSHTPPTELLQALSTLNTKLEERARITDELFRKLIQEGYEKTWERLSQSALNQERGFAEFKETVQQALYRHRTQFDERQLMSLKTLQESLQKTMNNLRDELSERVDKLTGATDQRLKEISGQVEKRLSEGFEKTTATFTDIIKRLALIDEAQKKITELSTNVVSLQAILADKRSRGAFGEVQLSALIRNMMPENSFEFQHVMSNGKRVDCLLFLPPPTGHIGIDAKFPLESYQRMTDIALSQHERQTAEQQFRQNIKKHVQDIAEKYIISGETSEGAVMFIPAEAVFAEIHAHFPELVAFAQKLNVWMVSPTTMMAILTTARAVLKDEATRQQVHVIQEHLGYLSKDFDRFQERMGSLARHISQAGEDVSQVNISAQKISARFKKIDNVELGALEETSQQQLKSDS